MSKVKMLLDVVEEVKKEAPQDVPNWTSKLAESNSKGQIVAQRCRRSSTGALRIQLFGPERRESRARDEYYEEVRP